MANCPPPKRRKCAGWPAPTPKRPDWRPELQSIKTAFAGDGQTVAVPETREFYWSKIERQIQREGAVRRAAGPWWPERLRRWLAPLAGAAALAAVLVVGLYQFRPQEEAFNQVAGTMDAMQPRTFRDGPSGISFVVFHETAQPSAKGIGAAPVRVPQRRLQFYD